MTTVLNVVRVSLAGVWTAIVGLPLIVVIYLNYWYGLLRARLGRRDVLDRILEVNAHLAGRVAQSLWAGVLCALAGVRVRVREVRPVDWSVSHVICANHASLFDILALVRVVPPPFRFVAKRELLRWPIIGWALRPAGQIVIDRSNRAQALRSIAEAAVRRIRGQVIFFVEGTRTRTGHLLPFKKGAFHFAIDNQLAVLPTGIGGSYTVLAKLPWWRIHPGQQIDVTFCQPIAPLPPGTAEGQGHRVEALLDATRAQIAEVLGRAPSLREATEDRPPLPRREDSNSAGLHE